MTPELRARITELRQTLEDPEKTAAGYLAPPSIRRSFPKEFPLSYQAFLREADGAACGVVIIYSSDDVMGQQDIVRSLPGGKGRWFCIGAVEDYPLVMELSSGTVHLVPAEGDFVPEESFGELDYFLLTSVFGPEYADFVVSPCEDLWYQIL